MAVEFLDEVQQQPGVEWLDEPAASGVEFMDESSPADPKDVARRFLDPNYQPTLAEFKIYDEARRSRTVGQHVSDDLELVGGAVAGLWDTVVGAAKAIPAMVKDPEANDPLVTAAEAVGRGTMRDLQLVKQLLPSEVLGDGVTNFDQFTASKLAEINRQKFRYNPLTPENVHTLLKPADVPPDVLANWRKEYDEQYVPEGRFEQFLEKRGRAQSEIKQAQSRASIFTGQEAPISPEIAEATSLVASPLAVVPFGKALTPAKTVTRAIAAKTLEGAGKTFEWVGEKTVQTARLPERAAGAAVRAVSGSTEAGAKAAEQVATGIAGVSTLPVKAVGKTITGAGQAAQAVGRQTAAGPSRYGLFERITKDAKSPEWMRRAANASKGIDPAVSLAGAAAKGATEGAAIGTVLGGVAEGEEGAASGFGAGVALGAGGGMAGRILGGKQYRAGLEDMDIARWLAAKPEADALNLRSLNLSRDQALALADTERLARGVVEPGQSGDVEFRYVGDKDFSQMFGVGRGAQVMQGDRPVVFVNTGYKGPRTVFHEVLHALDALEGSAPQRQRLNRILFDQTLPDGQTISKGIYSAADLTDFTSQYRSRLNEAARSEFDLLTPEARQQRIMSEVRSESFANLLSGRKGGASVLASRGLRSRVTDAMLAADHASMLGKMRRALESVGIKFDASGEPSELFVRNGRPITNTPAVDAALRDYLRAKDQLTRKLTAGDEPEEPSLVVRPQDLLSKGNTGLVETFKDHDIFAKTPDGKVKMLGGVPVLLSEREIRLVQSKRVDAMIEALTRTPNVGEAGAVKLKENGAWEGKQFSENQLAAIEALPDDVLSPSMKAKLRDLNTLAQTDGAQIILDYNAALKSGKYSSGIAPTTRAAVPLAFNISKAGNFFMTTLDTSHFFRKLGEWRRSKPKAFEPWGGAVDAFMRDTFAYLDNHVNGRPGSVNLDSDPAVAVHKKNVINDFFNVPKGVGNEDANPVQLSARGNKDNLIRSRRFDRINRITPGAGDRFPIRYEMQKKNFLPTGPVKETNNQLGWINDVWAARIPNEAAWEVSQLMKIAPRGGVVTVNPGFPNYKAFITRSPKDPKYPYQTTWFYDDGDVSTGPIPVGDRATTTYEDAVKVALNAGFTHESLLDKRVRNKYASEHAKAFGSTEAGGPLGLQTQSGSEGRTREVARPAPAIGQAGANPRTAQVNFLPAASPVAIHKQIQAQTLFDLARKVPGPPNLGNWLAAEYVPALDRKLNRGSRETRTEQLKRLQALADQTTPQDLATAFAVLMSQGRKEATAHLERLAVMKAALAVVRANE